MLANLPARNSVPQILTTDQSWGVKVLNKCREELSLKGSEVFGPRSLGEAAGRNEENPKKLR